MEITLITPGKAKQPFFIEAEKEFVGRLRRFCGFEIAEVKEEKLLKNTNLAEAKRHEAQRMREKIAQGSVVIALDEHGKNLTSVEFARLLESLATSSQKISFLIGGANGLAPELVASATQTISLGKMTLSQDLARVVFLEQIYRAFTINAGLPYHRE